jgi:hypothetical protein
MADAPRYHFSMATCSNCASTLDPAWRFCIFCGTPVIPAAIRPDAAATATKTGPALPTTLSILAIIFGILIGVATIVFLVSRAH